MNLEDGVDEFKYLEELPGKKLMLKGNHDYWWTTVTKMKNFLIENNFNSIDFLYNNSYYFENSIITGTKGCNELEEKTTEKILKREVLRLELSIKNGINNFGDDKKIIVFMHYPPFTKNNEFIDILKKYNVKKCIYGHLHGEALKDPKVRQNRRNRIYII